MAALRKLLSIRPGIMTTEFWAHAIVSLISLLVAIGLVPVGLPNADQTWVQLGAFLAAALCTGLYALSRGKVKAGASSLVTLLDHAVTTLLNQPDTRGMGNDLLHKVLPELEGLTPGATGDIEKIYAYLREHDAWLEDLANKLRGSTFVTHVNPSNVQVPVTTVSTSGLFSAVDPLSSTGEISDGTTEPSPGGWPAGMAAEPVQPAAPANPAVPAGVPTA